MPPDATVSKLTRSATEVAKGVPLSPEARSLLRTPQTARQFLDELVGKGQFNPAVQFLAHVLPKRAAVWWACLCVRKALAADAPPEAKAALAAAERWVSAADEDARRAAQAAAEAAGFDTPAGCAALGAFFSGGSLAPPGLADVPPGETLTGAAVAGAVTLSAVAPEPAKASERFKAFLALGADVDGGKNRWPDSPPRPAAAPRAK